MGRAVIILRTDADRVKAADWIRRAKDMSRIEFKGPARSLDQNALMWELLTQVAEQITWHGLKLTAEDYKDLLSASLRRELRTVPNMTGDGFVVLGRRTSDMSVAELGELVDLIMAFGAMNGVKFSAHPKDEEKARAA